MSRYALASALGAILVAACESVAGLTGGDDDLPLPTTDGATPDRGNESDGPFPNASDGSAGDGDAAAPSCDLSKPFGTAEILTPLNSVKDDWGPRLSGDERTLFFASSRVVASPVRAYQATRRFVTDPFGDVGFVPGLDTGFNAAHPSATANAFTIYWQGNGPSSVGKNDIYFASRGSASAAFSGVASVPNINTADEELSPFVTGDGTVLLFASDRSGDFDIYWVDRTSAGGATVIDLGTTGIREEFPVLSDDRQTLYYARDVGGQFKIFVAKRAAGPGLLFTGARALDELDTPSYEAPGWLTPDGCTLYFMSNRPTGVAGGTALDLYRATKPK